MCLKLELNAQKVFKTKCNVTLRTFGGGDVMQLTLCGTVYFKIVLKRTGWGGGIQVHDVALHTSTPPPPQNKVSKSGYITQDG
jgi:hypothetical protein